MSRSRSQELSDEDYARLLAFRDGLRRFNHWSEEQASAAGLTHAQHQLLLAIRGHPGDPTVSDAADHLLLRHHSVVGLVDRAERAGLVERVPDEADRRVVRLRLTRLGAGTIRSLTEAHLTELERLPFWAGFDPGT